MASSTLGSPSTTTIPCLPHFSSASPYTQHRPPPRSSSERSLKLRFCLSFWDCAKSNHAPICGFCRKDCAKLASFYVRACSSSVSSVSSLMIARTGTLNLRGLPGIASCATTNNRCNGMRIRASSAASLASSPKKMAKETSAETPVIQQPSLTWGIVPHSLDGKLKVIEFLNQEGIDTSELQGVELPNTVEVMQERLEFLKKLGLNIQVINSYPLMVTCSIKKNLIPVLDYLERLGLRPQELPAFVEKYPMILHSSVIVDLMPVVDYLLGLDIKRKDVIKVLRRYPDVLGFRLEGTMSTSVAYLVGLGVRTRCIGRMLTEYPEILGMRVAKSIKPKVDFLTSYGIPKVVVAKLLEARPYILGFDLDETMEPVVDDLLEAGIRREGIANIISQYPDILGRGIKEHLIRKSKWLVQDLKVAPNDVPVIVEKLPQILFIKEGLALDRVKYFRKSGCSSEEVAKMVAGCPQILALSIAHVIEPSMKYLLNDMNRSVKELVEFPAYFTYDLKSRIIPRNNVIVEKGVDCSLEWFLNCTDERFKLRISNEYMDDESPGPIFRMGGLVHTELKPLADDSSAEEEHVVQSANQRSSRGQQLILTDRKDTTAMLQKRWVDMTDIDSDECEENDHERENTGDIVRSRMQDMYDTDDDTDEASDILHARLHNDDDLDELDSASDVDLSEEDENSDDCLEETEFDSDFDVSLDEEESDDDTDNEMGMPGPVSDFDESRKDKDDVSVEAKVQQRFTRKQY